MKGKQKVIIGIIAAVAVVGIVAAVVLGMSRGKSDKTINVGNATESDEMSSWRTDGHRVAKAESGYYYLEWSDTDSTTMLIYHEIVQNSIVCINIIIRYILVRYLLCAACGIIITIKLVINICC